jgi:hypothetical protein
MAERATRQLEPPPNSVLTVPDPVEVECVLECAECGRPSELDAAGWRAMWTDDEPPAVVVFCPESAEREFDD